MLMNALLSTELFNLLAENCLKVSNNEMKTAYETFVKKIETLNQSETDFQTIFRILNITRIEFRTLQLQILCEQGEKCA